MKARGLNWFWGGMDLFYVVRFCYLNFPDVTSAAWLFGQLLFSEVIKLISILFREKLRLV